MTDSESTGARYAIILAAGESRRMGRPKALLAIDGISLVTRHASRFAEAGCRSIVIATRPELLEPVRDALRDVERATAIGARTASQGDTLRVAAAGLELADDAIVFVTPVDVLPPALDVLERLADSIHAGAEAATPRFEGRGGHPVALRATSVRAFAAAPLTLREHLEALADRRLRVDVHDPRVLGDFDEPRDLQRPSADPTGSHLLPLLVVALAAVACQDNEQRARAIGTTAREAVAARCPPHAADAADAADAAAEEDDACTTEACRDECARRDVPRGFDAACRETCRQTGICATNEDCGAGKACVAVAPVVRRCVTKSAPP